MNTDNNTPSKESLKQKLDDMTYHVTQEQGTEPAFSGEYYKENSKGTYNCAVCGNPLFSSETKYETKIPGLIGWPSFADAIPGSVEFRPDDSLGMQRTEVVCSRCKSHLGHIFDDEWETTTGKHYCINSCSLNLEKAE